MMRRVLPGAVLHRRCRKRELGTRGRWQPSAPGLGAVRLCTMSHPANTPEKTHGFRDLDTTSAAFVPCLRGQD
jgi:hypothetical protein